MGDPLLKIAPKVASHVYAMRPSRIAFSGALVEFARDPPILHSACLVRTDGACA